MSTTRTRAVNAVLILACALLLAGFVALSAYLMAQAVVHVVDGIGEAVSEHQ